MSSRTISFSQNHAHEHSGGIWIGARFLRVWSALRNGKFGIKFRRQHLIGPFIADFYSREANLVVEVDGETHRGSEAHGEGGIAAQESYRLCR